MTVPSSAAACSGPLGQREGRAVLAQDLEQRGVAVVAHVRGPGAEDHLGGGVAGDDAKGRVDHQQTDAEGRESLHRDSPRRGRGGGREVDDSRLGQGCSRRRAVRRDQPGQGGARRGTITRTVLTRHGP